jgi:phage baseplate assembly protein gpV/phage protein D
VSGTSGTSGTSGANGAGDPAALAGPGLAPAPARGEPFRPDAGRLAALAVLPRVTLESDGGPVAREASAALVALRVQQRLSLPALCELTFRDPPGPLTVAATLTPGAALRVLVAATPAAGAIAGPPAADGAGPGPGPGAAPAVGGGRTLFEGQVTAVEHVYAPDGGRELRVRGYDALHRLRKRQTVRAHVQVTPRDLARDLVSDLGLDVQADEPGPLWPRLLQHRRSDLDLLVDVAERSGLYLTLRGQTLHLLSLRGRGAGSDEPLPLLLGASLLEARLEVNGDPACRSVEALGWDALRAEVHRGAVDRPRSGREVPASAAPDRFGESGKVVLVDGAAPDTPRAEALAQAELDRRAAREVTLWGVAGGDPRLTPGVAVEVGGVAPEVAGRYVLTEVSHSIDGRFGFVSEVSSAPPERRASAPAGSGAVPGGPRPAVVALGQVTRVDDPDGLGRVQVSLPTYGEVDAGWLEVVCPGAGGSKGLVALPDTGDRVLVLFPQDDPAQGIVLGGLYGAAGPPDSGVESGQVRRYTFRTAGGQRLQLDDAGRRLRLEDEAGSYIELGPERVLLHAAVDLDIAAPGRAVTIRGQSIDFDRA